MTFHEPLLRSARPPVVGEQADRLLAELGRRFPRPGQIVNFEFDDQALQAITWSVDKEELLYLTADYLADEKHFLSTDGRVHLNASLPFSARIAPAGWAYLQSGGASRSTQGFIAMWFDSATEELRELGLKPAVERAGYHPFLVDESLQNKPIDSEIVANIRRSRLLVADLHCGDSGPRGGVYFEAGYAMGHNIPVFWTCKQSDLEQKLIHFDVRQYVFTPWSSNGSWDPFVQRLSTLIEANEGAGPFKRNS